ncbi:histidine kinase dimerization/phospho-acceptor domain-containing protein [Corallococcus sp. M7]
MASSVPSVQEVSDPVVGAARYDAVPPLMDSLLHDVRNPLNALAIHLEVLSEKLKGESGQVPATQEKNLKAMREQIARVDGLLKLFSDFMVFRGAIPPGTRRCRTPPVRPWTCWATRAAGAASRSSASSSRTCRPTWRTPPSWGSSWCRC